MGCQAMSTTHVRMALKKDNEPAATISLDIILSPVNRVSYSLKLFHYCNFPSNEGQGIILITLPFPFRAGLIATLTRGIHLEFGFPYPTSRRDLLLLLPFEAQF